jgi:hypothetical protein
MKRWKTKLPLIVGVIYIIAAMPFILGVCEPSVHEGVYPALFCLLNYPALLIISTPLKSLEKMAFSEDTLHTSNLLFLAAILVFWLVLALAIGSLIDCCRRKTVSPSEKHSSKAASYGGSSVKH